MFPRGYSCFIGDLSNASSQLLADAAWVRSADHVSRFDPGITQPEPQFNLGKFNHRICVTIITQSSTGLTRVCTRLGELEVNRVSCPCREYNLNYQFKYSKPVAESSSIVITVSTVIYWNSDIVLWIFSLNYSCLYSYFYN